MARKSFPRTFRLRRRLFLFGACAALALVLFRLPWLLIQKVRVSGMSVLDEQDLASVVSAELAGNRWLLVPRASIFFYPAAEIRDALLAQFPRLADAQAPSLPFGTLDVSVRERTLAYLWCADGACDAVDQSGFIFDRAPTFSTSTDVAFLIRGGGYAIGARIFSFPSLLAHRDAVASVLRDWPALGSLASVDISSQDDVFTIARADGSSWRILVGRQDDPSEIASHLRLVLSSLALSHSGASASPLRLAYLDLRFGEKVFYKFTTP